MTDSTTTRTAAGYIATDHAMHLIYGIGLDPCAARRDAMDAEPTGDYVTLPATQRLLDAVEDMGGADVSWHITDGVADLED